MTYHIKKGLLFILLFLFCQLPQGTAFIIGNVGQLNGWNKGLVALLSLIGVFTLLMIGLAIAKKFELLRSPKGLVSKKNGWLMIASYVVMQLSSNLLLFFQVDNGNHRTTLLNNAFENIPTSALFLCIGIVAPILEEIVFRGYIMNNWFKDSPKIGLLVSVITFTFAHTPGNIFMVALYSVSSLIFGIVYLKSKRLGTSMIIHIANNLPAAFSLL